MNHLAPSAQFAGTARTKSISVSENLPSAIDRFTASSNNFLNYCISIETKHIDFISLPVISSTTDSKSRFSKRLNKDYY